MASYASLYLGGYPLISSKHFVDPIVLMLFTERDKQIRMPEEGDVDYDPLGGAKVNVTPEVVYVASVAIVKDRLEFMGYTLTKIREEFRHRIEEQLAQQISILDHSSVTHAKRRPKLEAEIELLKTLAFDNWLEALGFIIRGNHHPRDSDSSRGDNFPPLVRFLLSESREEGVWMPFYDSRSSVRAAIEVTGIKPEVVYDVGELVADETYDPEDDLCGWARREAAEEFMLNHKVIVLTEGKVDKRCIEGALQLLILT